MGGIRSPTERYAPDYIVSEEAEERTAGVHRAQAHRRHQEPAVGQDKGLRAHNDLVIVSF